MLPASSSTRPVTIYRGFTPYTLTQHMFRADEWLQMLARAPHSSLEQSYYYGAAEAMSSAMPLSRFVISKGRGREERPVAAFQALEKRFMGVLSLVKVSRGPVFLDPLLTREEYHIIFRLLRKRYRRLSGRFLVLTPELEDNEVNEKLVKDAGYHHFSSGFSSVRVDLDPDEKTLRRNLDQKWRNQLAKAEKAGLELEDRLEEASAQWLLDNYRMQLAEKAYHGESPQLVTQLIEMVGEEPGAYVFLLARKGGTPVAATLSLCHGNCATYFIGYSTGAGRKHNATQLLLWETMRRLKAAGVMQFDLGGIYLHDKHGRHAAGLTHFKKGLGGTPYTLTGTFV